MLLFVNTDTSSPTASIHEHTENIRKPTGLLDKKTIKVSEHSLHNASQPKPWNRNCIQLKTLVFLSDACIKYISAIYEILIFLTRLLAFRFFEKVTHVGTC